MKISKTDPFAKYFMAICYIAIVWFVGSTVLALKIVPIEDPGWDSVETISRAGGHTLYSIEPKDRGLDKGPPLPRWLNIARKIVYFPSSAFDDVSKGAVQSDRGIGGFFFGCEVVDSLFWGMAGVCFYGLVKSALPKQASVAN